MQRMYIAVLLNPETDKLCIMDIQKNNLDEAVYLRYKGDRDANHLERDVVHQSNDKQRAFTLLMLDMLLLEAVGYQNIKNMPGRNIDIPAWEDIYNYTVSTNSRVPEASHRKLNV